MLPGFIDPHVHGGAGADVGRARMPCGAWPVSTRATAPPRSSRPRSPRRVPTCSPRFAASARQWRQAIRRGSGARGAPRGSIHQPGGARRAAPNAIAPDLSLVEELAALVPIRAGTMAPEIDPEGVPLAHFRALGTRAQIGHIRPQLCAGQRSGARRRRRRLHSSVQRDERTASPPRRGGRRGARAR